ncbi:MAG: trimethylamine methyltransferase family protein [Candidatus Hodarchaeota archaeon]
MLNSLLIGLEVIENVATNPKKGVTYLSEKHTQKYRRTTWRKRGSKDTIERARDRVNELLQNYVPPEINIDIETKLLSITKEIEGRSIDLYKEAEGITADGVSIGHIEIRTDKEK